jgi:hypothetical protein
VPPEEELGGGAGRGAGASAGGEAGAAARELDSLDCGGGVAMASACEPPAGAA